jgi:hypothetical protein
MRSTRNVRQSARLVSQASRYHFAALEAPGLLTADLQEFFRDRA